MADGNAGEEERGGSPAKRKPDLPGFIDEEEHIKKRKLESPSRNDAIARAADEEKNDLKEPVSTLHPEEGEEDDDEDGEDNYEGEEDDDGDEDEDEDELSDDEEAKVNSKGKAIARDDKGKGKLIEESDDDDDDCESELSDVDTDLSDDPLAEVDLDNILPSRTRRRSAQPGLHISNEGNDNHGSNA